MRARRGIEKRVKRETSVESGRWEGGNRFLLACLASQIPPHTTRFLSPRGPDSQVRDLWNASSPWRVFKKFFSCLENPAAAIIFFFFFSDPHGFSLSPLFFFNSKTFLSSRAKFVRKCTQNNNNNNSAYPNCATFCLRPHGSRFATHTWNTVSRWSKQLTKKTVAFQQQPIEKYSRFFPQFRTWRI